MGLDQVVLVDEQDYQIGVMDKIEAHRGKALRHRASSVMLFNNKNQLLIQQRSKKKIVGALQWANTCCGNVWPNETYEACAKRRLKLELGIEKADIKKLFVFEYHVQCNTEFSEWEIDTVFVGKYNGKVVPNPQEVKNIEWRDVGPFISDVTENKSRFVPWLPIILQKQEMMSYIHQYLVTKTSE